VAVGTSLNVQSMRMSRGGVHSSEVANPEEYLTYGFKSSASSPNLIDSVFQMFVPKLLKKIVFSRMDSVLIISDSMRETASKFSTQSGIYASYGAFSASAKLSTETLSTAKEKKLRVDRLTEVYTHKVTRSTPYPSRLLTEDAIEFLQTETPGQIVETLGEFFAKSIRLGGVLRVTNLVEMSESDDKESLGWAVSAGYGLGNSISGSTEGNVSSGQFGEGRQVNSVWQTLGGNSSVWFNLAVDDSNIAEVQSAWQSTFSDENAFPVRQELMPIWRILDRVNTTKRDEVEKYLTEKWEKENKTLVDGEVVTDLSRFCAYCNAQIDRCQITQGEDNLPYPRRFCWKALAEGKGPKDALKVCHGTKYNGETIWPQTSGSLVSDADPPKGSDNQFCFDAWPDSGKQTPGTAVYCNYYDRKIAGGFRPSWLVQGRKVPSWTSLEDHFCFYALPAE